MPRKGAYLGPAGEEWGTSYCFSPRFELESRRNASAPTWVDKGPDLYNFGGSCSCFFWHIAFRVCSLSFSLNPVAFSSRLVLGMFIGHYQIVSCTHW